MSISFMGQQFGDDPLSRSIVSSLFGHMLQQQTQQRQQMQQQQQRQQHEQLISSLMEKMQGQQGPGIHAPSGPGQVIGGGPNAPITYGHNPQTGQPTFNNFGWTLPDSEISPHEGPGVQRAASMFNQEATGPGGALEQDPEGNFPNLARAALEGRGQQALTPQDALQVASSLQQMNLPAAVQQGILQQLGIGQQQRSGNVSDVEHYIRTKFGDNPTPEQVLQGNREFFDSRRQEIGASFGEPLTEEAIKMEAEYRRKTGRMSPGFSARDVASQRAVRNYMAKHFPETQLATAELERIAHTRFVQAANSPHSRKLLASINQAEGYLPRLQDALKKWKEQMGDGLRTWNRIQFQAALENVYGPEIQAQAAAIEGIFTDYQDALASMYSGGYQTTNPARELAKRNLDRDWTMDAIERALKEQKITIKQRREEYLKVRPILLDDETGQSSSDGSTSSSTAEDADGWMEIDLGGGLKGRARVK